ncbi:MAG TPA: hypothetical protein VN033_12435 [Vulgatibacter sp.]|nr:hypothetical protein [Vulgatibacter sp.]
MDAVAQQGPRSVQGPSASPLDRCQDAVSPVVVARRRPITGAEGSPGSAPVTARIRYGRRSGCPTVNRPEEEGRVTSALRSE